MREVRNPSFPRTKISGQSLSQLLHCVQAGFCHSPMLLFAQPRKYLLSPLHSPGRGVVGLVLLWLTLQGSKVRAPEGDDLSHLQHFSPPLKRFNIFQNPLCEALFSNFRGDFLFHSPKTLKTDRMTSVFTNTEF